MKLKNLQGFLLAGILGFFLLFAAEHVISSQQLLEWLSQPLANFYPALSEKMRQFGPAFLQDIFSQLKWRWMVVVAFGAWIYAGRRPEVSMLMTDKEVWWRIRLLHVLGMIFLPDLLSELRFRQEWAALYEPLPQWAWLFPHFLPLFAIQWVGLLAFGSSAGLVLGKWKEESVLPFGLALLHLVCFSILLIFFFGFGKIDHTYSSMYAAFWGATILVWTWYRNPDFFTELFPLLQAFIWSCYFFSGLEKLFLSGLPWVSTAHFQVLARLHPQGFAHVLAPLPMLPAMLMTLALLFQLLAPLQWRYPNWGKITVIAGIGFHLGTYILFGIGGWFHPWLFMLLFLWPFQRKLA